MTAISSRRGAGPAVARAARAERPGSADARAERGAAAAARAGLDPGRPVQRPRSIVQYSLSHVSRGDVPSLFSFTRSLFIFTPCTVQSIHMCRAARAQLAPRRRTRSRGGATLGRHDGIGMTVQQYRVRSGGCGAGVPDGCRLTPTCRSSAARRRRPRGRGGPWRRPRASGGRAPAPSPASAAAPSARRRSQRRRRRRRRTRP